MATSKLQPANSPPTHFHFSSTNIFPDLQFPRFEEGNKLAVTHAHRERRPMESGKPPRPTNQSMSRSNISRTSARTNARSAAAVALAHSPSAIYVTRQVEGESIEQCVTHQHYVHKCDQSPPPLFTPSSGLEALASSLVSYHPIKRITRGNL